MVDRTHRDIHVEIARNQQPYAPRLQLAKAGQHLQPIGRRHAVVNDRGNEDRDLGGFKRRLAVETLSYSWNYAHADPAYALESVVTFTLTPTPAGTHLRMEQSGFRPSQKQALGGAHAGWNQFIEKLETVLAREA
jgi:uncharacterized protein YndB with AHSA1/START domain